MLDIKKRKKKSVVNTVTNGVRRTLRRTNADMPPELQGLLPNVSGDIDNKLPRELQGQDNEVWLREVAFEGGSGRSVFVAITWGGIPVTDFQEFTTPIDPDDLPAIFVLPGTKTDAPGEHRLSYISYYVEIGANPHFGPVVTIYIDKEAPNHGQKDGPLVLDNVSGDIIDLDFFENNTYIDVSIARPTDRATGDIANIYFGASIPGRLIGSTVPAADDSSADLTYRIDTGEITPQGEGERILYYEWEDRVGNVGVPSVERGFLVLLTRAPTNLVPPVVPDAIAPDKTVNVAVSFPTLAVEIEEYTNFVVNVDKVLLDFDGQKQTPQNVDGIWPVIVNVPYASVKRGGIGPRAARVSYEIERNPLVRVPELIGETVRVDLTRPGPPFPPEPEDPEEGNPNLDPVVVTGRGGTPGPDNTLERKDYGLDADATVLIFDASKADDHVQLFWNKVPVPAPGGTYDVEGDEDPSDTMDFVIPWDMIELTSNGVWPVHYEITSLTETNPNPSKRAQVSVHVLATTLPPPVIQGVTPSGFIFCSAVVNVPGQGRVVVVHVNGGGPLTAGMVLNFSWTGERLSSLEPGNPTDPDPGYPVPGAVPPYTFTKTLVAPEHVNGFDVYLPFTDAILPIRDGRGSIVYKAMVNNIEETSDPHNVEVVVVDSVNAPCPVVASSRAKRDIDK
ncbi:hypothetical protein [Pseudomonas sp. MWU12-2037]|uniref:hypothetical protein n=1 Tax=Pseudomonas sp. MWU12-2037 TaxID=2928690 RepID=UPI00200D85EE|nr:hypothetical protein [Pseudomonas sp. MWU12-2037]